MTRQEQDSDGQRDSDSTITADGTMRDNARDTYNPPRWSCDSEVSRVFDAMLCGSVPELRTIRYLTASLITDRLKDGGLWLDLGCSNGGMIAEVLEQIDDGDLDDHMGGRNILGVDVSEPMLTEARNRFRDRQGVNIISYDLRHGLPLSAEAPQVISAFLTMMYVPVERRMHLLGEIYEALYEHRGGAFLIVEKVTGNPPEIDDIMVEQYHRFKADSGYASEEPDRKWLSLEGELVPWTAQAIETNLRAVGFKKVDCYWRWMNFAAWIAVV